MSEPIVIETWMKAHPDTVFDYFTNPARLTIWQASEANVEFEPNGAFRLVITESAIASGRYLEIDRPNRLLLAWGWEGNDLMPPESSTVAIELVAERGGTSVTITHEGIPDPGARSQWQGWEHYLERLRIAVTGDDPGPDPWAQPTELDDNQDEPSPEKGNGNGKIPGQSQLHH